MREVRNVRFEREHVTYSARTAGRRSRETPQKPRGIVVAGVVCGGHTMKLSLFRNALAVSALTSLFVTSAGCSSADAEDLGESTEALSHEAARSYATVPYRGVNLSGGEFGQQHLPGTFGTDYTYPTCEEVEYFIHKGMNTFRLPVRWERLQRSLKGPLDGGEIGRIRHFVDAATARGARVILEPHNFAGYGWTGDAASQPESHVIGGSGVPVDALADFWGKVAKEVKRFDHPERVVFGLMNEPERIRTTTWFDAAERALLAIRAEGASNLVLVPGVRWTGAHDWSQTPRDPGNFDPGESSASGASAMLHRLRLAKRHFEPIAFEVHEYVDSDFSGTRDGDCSNKSTGHFEDFRHWLIDNGARGFVGEFAVPRNCAYVASEFAAYFEKHAEQFEGWTYWGGGPWWPKSYFLSIDPGNLAHGAILPQLSKHLNDFPGAVPNRCGRGPLAATTKSVSPEDLELVQGDTQ
jgi:endoglucanase